MPQVGIRFKLISFNVPLLLIQLSEIVMLEKLLHSRNKKF